MQKQKTNEVLIIFLSNTLPDPKIIRNDIPNAMMVEF